jgi:hypothetical protein
LRQLRRGVPDRRVLRRRRLQPLYKLRRLLIESSSRCPSVAVELEAPSVDIDGAVAGCAVRRGALRSSWSVRLLLSLCVPRSRATVSGKHPLAC